MKYEEVVHALMTEPLGSPSPFTAYGLFLSSAISSCVGLGDAVEVIAKARSLALEAVRATAAAVVDPKAIEGAEDERRLAGDGASDRGGTPGTRIKRPGSI